MIFFLLPKFRFCSQRSFLYCFVIFNVFYYFEAFFNEFSWFWYLSYILEFIFPFRKKMYILATHPSIFDSNLHINNHGTTDYKW